MTTSIYAKGNYKELEMKLVVRNKAQHSAVSNIKLGECMDYPLTGSLHSSQFQETDIRTPGNI